MNPKGILIAGVITSFIAGFSYIGYKDSNALKVDDSGIFRTGQNITTSQVPLKTLTPQVTTSPEITKEVKKLLEYQEDNQSYRKLQQNLGGVLKNTAEYSIIKWSKEYNVNQFLVAAIIKHESANGTSKAIKNQNNVAGLMGKNGKLKTFDTLDDSIKVMCDILRNYYLDENRDSIKKIQEKYAPKDALNDPNKLNYHWESNVTKYFTEISEDLK